jgi:predicted component of type VI protein secretion system
MKMESVICPVKVLWVMRPLSEARITYPSRTIETEIRKTIRRYDGRIRREDTTGGVRPCSTSYYVL